MATSWLLDQWHSKRYWDYCSRRSLHPSSLYSGLVDAQSGVAISSDKFRSGQQLGRGRGTSFGIRQSVRRAGSVPSQCPAGRCCRCAQSGCRLLASEVRQSPACPHACIASPSRALSRWPFGSTNLCSTPDIPHSLTSIPMHPDKERESF